MATLYRKYRPQRFDGLIGQQHILQTLQAALELDRVGHAYLFAGPRGTGKTTVARLLAKSINCPNVVAGKNQAIEPCNTCQICIDITEGRSLDVIEIDAASNRGIDEMRELRDKIKFAPSLAAKKVFIIDEVHMLTKEAFNALLKTLEEPPAHAIFVLATTELNKIPVTIASRCQVFIFKKARPEDLVSLLRAVADAEELQIEEEALVFLARLAGGSYRDGVSLLDQMSSAPQPITRVVVQEALGIASEERIVALLELVASGNTQEALENLSAIEADGIDVDALASQLIDAGRYLLHAKFGTSLSLPLVTDTYRARWTALAASWNEQGILAWIHGLVRARQTMKQLATPVLPLEVWVAELASLAKPSRGVSNIVEPEDKPIVETVKPVAAPAPKEAVVQKAQSPAPTSEAHQSWETVLSRVKTANASLHALLQQSEFGGVEGNRLVIRAPFSFVRDRLHETKYRNLVGQIVEDVFGAQLALHCEVCETPHTPIAIDAAAHVSQEVVDAALEVFGVDEAQPN